ncbi:MAG: amino acid adenylation domain-containing protein [Prochloraceae cyanobacterium]|nr:amino acid adenylation domain-containing protein [Prochloraceae cyanobacterium]
MAQLISPQIVFPFSSVQESNWFLHKLNPEGLQDKVSLAVRIYSEIDIFKIKNTFQILIERHSSLRTKYIRRDNKLIQEVYQNASLDFRVLNIIDCNEAGLNENLLKLINESFDLEKKSLFRVRLFKNSVKDFILLITLHQLAGDRQSLLILLSEFFSLYNSEELPSLNSDYRNYVNEELNLLNSNEAAKIVNYWETELKGELPVLSLPTNKFLPKLRTYNGSSCKFKCDRPTTEKLKQLAKRENNTVNNLLLSLFNVLLYRYSGEEDILIAIKQDRRNYSKCDRVIGNFDDAFVIRNIVDGESRLKAILECLNNKIDRIKENKNYPFPLLVQKFKSSANLIHSPICQAAFSYKNIDNLENIAEILESKNSKCGDLELKYLTLDREKVEFDLNLEIIATETALLGEFKYNCDLLDEVIIKQFTEHFQNLITSIVENNDLEIEIGKLNLLSDKEKQKITVNWNQTKRDYDLSQCLHQLIEKQVERSPDRIAVEFAENKLTYRQLNNQANQLANYLQKQGVQANNLVGISIERSLEMVIGLLGILKSGGAYVPIDPNYPSDRLAYMLEDSQTKILLTQETVKNKLPAHSAKTICLDSDWEIIERENNNNLETQITPDDLAYVIYTSGSTGKPKGAMNAHRGICNRLLWMQEEYQLNESDRILQKTPFSFDVSVWEFFWPLLAGARLMIAKPGGHTDPNYIANIIAAKEITTAHFVPSMLQVFLEEKDLEKCKTLKRVIASGEALPYKLQKRFFDRLKCELHNLYGPTEAAIDVTYWKCDPNSDLKKVPIGRPVANTQIYILDSYLQPVPIGVPGELHIGGVQVALGYLNRPELTAAKFIQDPFNQDNRLYKTGDLARYLPDGNIEYIRRIDRQIKIRGLRIELGEIENSISQHSDIRENLVIARSETAIGQQLIAYIVPKLEANNNISPAKLRTFLKEKLPDYMIPAAFVILESFPLTPNGKIDRRALPTPEISSFSGNKELILPRNEMESKLARIWSQLLNIEPVGVKDSFFDLGGHSLLAINLMSQIQQQFNKKLPLATLFTDRTIEDLAKRIDNKKDFTANSPLIPIQPLGNKEPFFCVHPAGGHVLCYVKLSGYLGSDRPFYGLQAQGFNSGETALNTVEEMASAYVKAIREFKPEGPYQIGGWSFGGVVAYEVAQQLQKQGQEVSLLALLDSYMPILLDKNKKIDDSYLVGVLSRVFGGMFGKDNLVTKAELAGLSVEAQISYIIDKARTVGIFPPEVEERENRRILDVLVGTLKATYAYRRQAYPGKVTIFRAENKHVMAPDPQLVWVELFSVLDVRDIEIISVPGNHYTFILEPHVRILAERLATRLQ